MSNATIKRLERINTVYVQTIREQDARIAELEQQLAAAQERERVYQEVYGELPDDIESTYQWQERELAALRAKLTDVYKIDKIKTDEINLLTHENREQSRQIKEMTAALAAASEKGCAE